PAMLIAALEIQIGWPGKSGNAAQHRRMARTGFEPYVDGVHLLAKLRPSALGAPDSGGKNRFRGVFVPGVSALASEQLDDRAIHRSIVEKFLASFALKHRDGDTPDALARNTPVGAGGDHVRDALFAPSRVPFPFLDFFQRTAAQRAAGDLAFHRDEPLLGGAEDDGIVTPPAVGIGVLDLVNTEQYSVVVYQQLDDGGVRLEDLLALILGQPVAQDAALVHVAMQIKTIFDAGDEVVRAVSRGGVHRAGSGVHGDVVAQHAEDAALQEGMSEGRVL